MPNCPLCRTLATKPHYHDKKRSFFLCDCCGLVFADPNSVLPPPIQRQRYGRAQKHSKQQQLEAFIDVLMTQLTSLGSQPLEGLNFGRVLSATALARVAEAGYQIRQFDPFFAPERQWLHQPYDFICSYRVFEHFHTPAREWQLLNQLLKPGAWLAISTPLLRSVDAFAKWHFKNNPTHVSFYQPRTFAYLAEISGLSLLFAEGDFVLMQKAA
ncbi:class I SAM-dependent methyltransferase [Shewanella sp. C32]|uniref:Class I SAM-dependent methyltransferase n=1 Tax=Shewanella electrica TaxID=515560 RepID=A0ABT2FLK0_9GAMM|nr:class I SAM-dependent methyltransferase [Shewanella electrica]MCH1925901.1 class I SAM-dependent methyltransferase [Shewanella electrica]MCS4557214.1 class I SAM-dependent methyltransferase [Shewanella electrica]